MATSITIRQKNIETGLFEEKEFPLVDIIPVVVLFNVTGLDYTPVEYIWDFGDGEKSNLRNPEHTYNTYGYHYIRVKIRDNVGNWIELGNDDNVIILGKLDFSADVREGDKLLNVQFTNLSISPTGYQFNNVRWDFGDGFYATGINGPSHIYREYGNYNIEISAELDKI